MKTLDGQGDLAIILDASGSPTSRLRAHYLGPAGEDGMKIEIGTALGPGTIVSVAGEVETMGGRAPVLGKYQVCSCLLAGGGRYHVHLAAPGQESPPPKMPKAPPAEDLNCYEVLQISRNADTDMIHRVFHLLAQRYHPDNRETGDEGKFRQIVEAHRVLGDDELRAQHDVRLLEGDKTRLRIFDSAESTQGVQAEIRKRQGILRLLYTKRLTEPRQPAMRARDLAEMLGCPAEHLDFSLWFLKENKLVNRSDNNQFEITWQGVEAFEATESSHNRKIPLPLPAPAHAG
jgi:hypothetical protein